MNKAPTPAIIHPNTVEDDTAETRETGAINHTFRHRRGEVVTFKLPDVQGQGEQRATF